MPIKPCNILPLDELRALGLAGIGIGAVAEAQLVHLGDHLLRSVGGLDLALGQQSQMAYFGTHKQHCAGILASRYAGATADARSCVHSHVGVVFWDGDGVGIGDTSRGGADVASRLDDLVESGTIHNKVSDDGEGFCAPRLNPDIIAIAEFAHMELASGDAIVITVGSTVDIQSAHTADALAAVVVEAHRVCDAVVDEPLVQNVEHFKE